MRGREWDRESVLFDLDDVERVERYLDDYGLLVSEFGRSAGLRDPKYMSTILRRALDNGSTRISLKIAARIEGQLRTLPIQRRSKNNGRR